MDLLDILAIITVVSTFIGGHFVAQWIISTFT
jgi:hypothetical protein